MDMSADSLRKFDGQRKRPDRERAAATGRLHAMLNSSIVNNEEETRCAP
jgi:hypothetical protein